MALTIDGVLIPEDVANALTIDGQDMTELWVDNVLVWKQNLVSDIQGNLLHAIDNPNLVGFAGGDQFGEFLATSESYSIASSIRDNGFVGTAYIIDNLTGNVLHSIANPSGNIDAFGKALAISETYSIVGVPDDDIVANNSGRAYIFNNATGAIVQTLLNPNSFNLPDNDQFGNAVAISNTHALVQANNETYTGSTSKGVVYVFEIATGNLLHTIVNPDAASTGFGSTLDINDNRFVLAHPRGNSGPGRAYVHDVVTGGLERIIESPRSEVNAAFGTYMALSSTNCIINVSGASATTSVHIFDLATGIEVRSKDDPLGAGNLFGNNVGINDTLFMLTTKDASSDKRVEVYHIDTGILAFSISSPETPASQFGTITAMSGVTLVMGAKSYNTGSAPQSGRIYIYV